MAILVGNFVSPSGMLATNHYEDPWVFAYLFSLPGVWFISVHAKAKLSNGIVTDDHWPTQGWEQKKG